MLEPPRDANGNRIRSLAREDGNLRGRKPHDEPAIQHLPVGIFHPAQLLERSRSIQPTIRLMPWVDCWFESCLQKLIERGFFLPTRVINNQIVRDAIQERTRMQDLVFALQTEPEAEKGILCKVFRHLTIAATPGTIAKDSILVEVMNGEEIVDHTKRRKGAGTKGKENYRRAIARSLFCSSTMAISVRRLSLPAATRTTGVVVIVTGARYAIVVVFKMSG